MIVKCYEWNLMLLHLIIRYHGICVNTVFLHFIILSPAIFLGSTIQLNFGGRGFMTELFQIDFSDLEIWTVKGGIRTVERYLIKEFTEP